MKLKEILKIISGFKGVKKEKTFSSHRIYKIFEETEFEIKIPEETVVLIKIMCFFNIYSIIYRI